MTLRRSPDNTHQVMENRQMRTIEELHIMLANGLPADAEAGQRLFQEACLHVRNGMAARRREHDKAKSQAAKAKATGNGKAKVDTRQPDDTAQNFFRRGAYLLIRSYLTTGREAVIQKLVTDCGNQSPRRPTFQDNPFHWGLLAMYSDRSRLSKERRRLYAHQMLYAHRHDVPEHFLIGFIHQLGRTDRIYGKVANDEREAWFKAGTSTKHGKSRL